MSASLILGASANPNRFSHRAQRKLVEQGYNVLLVNPKGGQIDGIECLRSLKEVDSEIDTVTIYIKPELVDASVDDLLALKPRRVIFNPGTESPKAEKRLHQQGIEVVNNCTLVMLDFNEY